jgi:hypothetical protein
VALGAKDGPYYTGFWAVMEQPRAGLQRRLRGTVPRRVVGLRFEEDDEVDVERDPLRGR